MLPSFARHLFKWDIMISYLRRYSQGLTEDRLRLYYHNFADIPVGIPPVEEQQRIADILSSITTSIDAGATKLTQLQQTKRGLMQDLLSGDVRVV